jgi:hypothetical protein
VALGGFGCLVLCVVLATLLPMAQTRRRLRPLAHVDRLTRLPEYARQNRVRLVSMVVTTALLVVMFCAAVLAAARPVGLSAAGRDFDARNPQDIMLCVGEPITDHTTGVFLNYFAHQASTYDTERIGLTSPTVRVVPLTRDHQYAVEQLADYAAVAQSQADVDAGKPLPAGRVTELRNRTEAFSRSVSYVDYATSLEDALALCMAGFPGRAEETIHRRSLVYLGPSVIGEPNEKRPSLFSATAIADMAARAGVQVNAVTRADVTEESHAADAQLRSLAESTGGKFFRYNAFDGSTATDQVGATLTAHLDAIRDNPPLAVLPDGTSVTGRSWDDPNLLLVVALVVGGLLCISLAVLRR